MNHSKISVRYSKALFSLALDKKMLDKVYNDMLLVFATCKLVDFGNFLENLVIPTSKKKSIVNKIFKEKIQDLSLSFINLIIGNKREPFLKRISHKFIDDYKKHMGIKSAKLVTATKIEKALEESLIKQIEESLKSKIELESFTNKDIIGGFILNLDDKQIDASVSTQLNKIKKELLNTSIEKKI